jgi:integrase
MEQRQVQVFDLARFMEKEDPKPRPFGSVRRRMGSTKLSIRFKYMGRVVEKSIGVEDTPENERKARAFLERVGQAITAGTFCFEEAFPGASDEEQAYFARAEGREYRKLPGDVTFGEYLEAWVQDNLESGPSEGKRRDYLSIIDFHLRDRFGPLTFEEITGVNIVQFVREQRERPGHRGGKLSSSRIRNILIPLRIIWEDACEEYHWDLKDPFRHLKRRNRNRELIPRRKKNPPEVFRFPDWLLLMEDIDPWYRPIAEVMVMTGLIHSEMAGLRRQDVQADRILVQNSIVRGREKEELKTEYRQREIPVTAAIRGRLATLGERTQGEHLVTSKHGARFDGNKFRGRYWVPALERAGLPYRRPYATRHTFAAWSLMMGIHPDRVVRLMGHGSRQMVYEVYGRYVDGLEDDVEGIRAFFGPDFR